MKKLFEVIASSDDLMYNKFLAENTLYDDDTKEEFANDERSIMNAFVINFVGILGAYNAAIQTSNERALAMVKRYFKSDGALKLDNIGDSNNNISLVIKLMADKGMFISNAKVVQMTRFLTMAKQGNMDLIDDEVIREWINNIKMPMISKADPKIKDVLLKFKNGVINLVDSTKELRKARAKYAGTADELWKVSKSIRFTTKDKEPKDSKDDEIKSAVQTAEPVTSSSARSAGSVEPEVATPSPEPKPIPAVAEPNDEELVPSTPDDFFRARMIEYLGAKLTEIGFEGIRVKDHERYSVMKAADEDNYEPVKGLSVTEENKIELHHRARDIIIQIGAAVDPFTTFSDETINGVDLTTESLKYAGDFRVISKGLGRIIKNGVKLANVQTSPYIKFATNNALPIDKISSYFGISQKDLFGMMLEDAETARWISDEVKNPYSYTIGHVFSAFSTVSDTWKRDQFVSAYAMDVIEYMSARLIDTAPDNIVPTMSVYGSYDFLLPAFNKYAEIINNFWKSVRDEGYGRKPMGETLKLASAHKILTLFGHTDMLKQAAAAVAAINAMEVNERKQKIGDLLFTGRKIIEQALACKFQPLVSQVEDIYIGMMKDKQFFTGPAGNIPITDANIMDTIKASRGSDLKELRADILSGMIAQKDPTQIANFADMIIDRTNPASDIIDIVHFISSEVPAEQRKFVMTAAFSNVKSIPNDMARSEAFLTVFENTDQIDKPSGTSYFDYTGRYKLTPEQSVRLIKLEIQTGGLVMNKASEIKGRDEKANAESADFDIIWDCIQSNPELANEYYETLPTAIKTKIRNRVTSTGAVFAQLNAGPIDVGAKMTAERIKDIFAFNGLDANEIASKYKLKAVKGESISDYSKRVMQATETEAALDEIKITDLNMSASELAGTMDYMIRNFHAGKHGDTYPKITKAFSVHLPDDQFNAFRAQMEESGYNNSIIPAFHGTGGIAASMILRYGFQVVPSDDASTVGRAIGDGIYFSNKIDKVVQYIGNAGFTRGHGTKGYVFEMDTVLGQPNVDYQSAGFSGATSADSNFVSPEWAVFNPNKQLKILKCYEVENVSGADAKAAIASGLNESKGRVSFKNVLTEAVERGSNAITYRFFDNAVPMVVNNQVHLVKSNKFEPNGKTKVYTDGAITYVVIKSSKPEVRDVMFRKMSTSDLETFIKLAQK